MRKWTKSMGSFSWAMWLFGLRQLFGMLTSSGGRGRRARDRGEEGAFDSVTRVLEEQLGQVLRTVFQAGDRVIRNVVDMTFGRPTRRRRRTPWMDGGAAAGTGPGMGGPEAAAQAWGPTDHGMEPGPGHPMAQPPPAGPSTGHRPPASGWGPMPPIPGPAPHVDPTQGDPAARPRPDMPPR